MANQYFVFKKLPELGEEFIIENQAAAHHIFTVMRAKSGDQIRLVFTDGEIGLSEVISPSDQSVKLIKLLTESSELPVQITVAVGFPKGDKLDFSSLCHFGNADRFNSLCRCGSGFCRFAAAHDKQSRNERENHKHSAHETHIQPPDLMHFCTVKRFCITFSLNPTYFHV